MEPLLSTLETAQGEYDSVNQTYNENAEIVDGGSKDDDGELYPE